MPIPIPLGSALATTLPGGEPPTSPLLVGFYIVEVDEPFPQSGYFRKMVRLAAPVAWNATSYYIVAAILSEEQEAALLASFPQPDSWTGTVADVKRALRASGLIHFWWLYDAFMRVNAPDGEAI